jgi:hypothetical protein
MRYIFLILALAPLAAETPKPEPPKAPQITAEVRAKFWRASAEWAAAQARAQAAKTALESAQTELQKTCGTDADVVAGQDGEPQCKLKKESK